VPGFSTASFQFSNAGTRGGHIHPSLAQEILVWITRGFIREVVMG